uniref:Mitochondrial import inner membrane translocase subunit Tim29 n=1 Tax=Lygus hesperus TaxID=30085 RepID=A0A0K8SP00_LYGHE
MGLRGVAAKLGGWRTTGPFNSLYNQYDHRRKIVSAYYERVSNAFKLPERFKGTFVERWAEYWQAVSKDYKDVLVDAVKDVRDKPAKGALLATLFGVSYYCAKRNPDEASFRDTLLTCSNDFIFVGPPIRNPETTRHLSTLEQYYNEGVIQRFSFGVFSIMWVDNYRDSVGAYKATCQYLTPEWLKFRKRIVDVGFLNRWWILEKKMVDCDINPEEWKEDAYIVNNSTSRFSYALNLGWLLVDSF